MRKEPNPFYKRDTEWLRLYKKGSSLAEIGKQYSVSRERVRQVITRGTPTAFYIREDIPDKSWHGSGRDYVRQKVRERDMLQCQGCARTWQVGERAFDVHHLKGKCGKKSRGYDRIGNMKDLTTFCHKCHMQRHSVYASESEAYKKRKSIRVKKLLEIRKSLMQSAREKGVSYDQIGALFGIKQSAAYIIINGKKSQ